MKQITIIIVNWNNVTDTIDCLDSIMDIARKNVKIVVIDNGSTDGSVLEIADWVRQKGQSVEIISEELQLSPSTSLTIISLRKNIGFSMANNIGMRYAIKYGSDFVLLLNNDTIVSNGFLDCLKETASNVDNPGIIGCKIKHFPETDKIWFSGGQIDTLRGAFYHCEDDCSGLRESEFITGCLMFIPTDVIKRVGFFDGRYFLNVEDIDLSWRVRKAGYKLFVDCDIVIYHKFSASIGGLFSARNQYYFHRNRMLFFTKKLHGIKKLFFFTFQFAIAIPTWIVINILKGKFDAVKGAFLGYYDFIRGHWGKSKYF